jgi:ABC-type glycerol-3-phosphate transport system substrate-binding protein
MNIKFKQKWGFIFLLFLIITYLTISFFDYGYPAKEVKKIYFADMITAAHKILIDEYNKLHEGKVEVIPVDFPNADFTTNERKEVVARSLRGHGDGIDLFAVDIIWVERFAKWCEPLDKYFPVQDRDKILDKALESCYYDSELVAVPLDMVQGVMYYRKDLLQNVKGGDKFISKINNYITWKDFIRFGQEAGIKDSFYIFPGADFEGLVCCYLDQLFSLKPNYFKEDGFNFDTPQADQALQLFVDIINKYKIAPSAAAELTDVTSFEYFIKHNAIFLRGWPTYIKDFSEKPIDAKKQSQLAKAPIPYFKKGQPASVFGGWDLMVSKFSDKKKEAVDFVKFLLSNKSQEIFYKESGYYPIVKKFYEDSLYLNRYPEISEFKELMKTGVHRPAHVEYTKFSKILSYYINKAIRKEIPVKEALIKCTKDIQLDKLMVQ